MKTQRSLVHEDLRNKRKAPEKFNTTESMRAIWHPIIEQALDARYAASGIEPLPLRHVSDLEQNSIEYKTITS
eukprot:5966974-Pyramimonas_sp.AAC.1